MASDCFSLMEGGTPLRPSPNGFLTEDWDPIISLSVFLGVPLSCLCLQVKCFSLIRSNSLMEIDMDLHMSPNFLAVVPSLSFTHSQTNALTLMVLKWSLVGGWVACIHHPIPLVRDPLPLLLQNSIMLHSGLFEVGISAHFSVCSVVTMPLCPQCNSFMLRMQSSCWRVDHFVSISRLLSH